MAQKQKSEERKLTAEQLECIENRGNNLLVSASAGSGKTFVMIERIKEMIKRKEVSVSNILVVTFTKSAAGEMKARLVKGLEEVENKDDYIKEQLLEVNSASICTLHSFCSKMLKTYFYAIGLDPAFTLIDEEESNSLRAKAFAKLIDNAFVDDDKDFFELLDCFSVNRKEDNFKENINKFYEFLLTIVDSDDWFNKTIEKAYTDNLDQNVCAKYINEYISKNFERQLYIANNLLKDDLLLKNDKLVAYINSFCLNLLKVKSKNTFTENQKALKTLEKIPTMPVLKDEFVCLKPMVNEFKEYTKDLFEKAQELYLKDSGATLSKKLSITKSHLQNLYKIVRQYEAIYSDLKKEKVSLDFSDLEQNMIKLLAIPEIRESIRTKYKYVFVDEYQDTNAIQEAIIKGVAGENNLFMVGDVKQSIYRFRASEPEIFVNKYNLYGKSSTKNSKAIKLNANFRSHKDILDFSNEVFLRAMTPDFGGVNYYKDAMFVVVSGDSSKSVINGAKPVKVCVLSEPEKERADAEEQSLCVYSVKNHTEEESENIKKAEAEGEVLAQNIKQLLNSGARVKKRENQPLTYRDIAILSQNRGEYLENVLKVLDKNGIPYTSDIKQDIFENVHINALHAFLMLADNRNNDIPLFTVLQSVFSDFTINEISEIRRNNREKKFFYQAFFEGDRTQLAKRTREKVDNFIALLDNLTFYSKFLKVDEMLKKLINVLDFETRVLKTEDGKLTLNLLNKFLTYIGAKSYNSKLSDYLESVQENEITFASEPNENACLVTTIHQSKGLEYPAVFLIGAGTQLLNKQAIRDFIPSKELGVGIPYQDIVVRTKCSLLPLNAIKLQTNFQNLEEKLRLLYVALTRAVQNLYIIGFAKKAERRVEPFEAKTFMDWIMPVVFAKSVGGLNSFVDFDVENYTMSKLNLCEEQGTNVRELNFSEPNEKFIGTIQNVLSFVYPYAEATKRSVKTSVSELLALSDNEVVSRAFAGIDNSVAIAKGNCYHKFMQTVNLAISTEEEIKKHIISLVKSGEISQADAKLIDVFEIKTLLTNPLFKMLSKGKVYKEQEFISKTDYNKDMQKRVGKDAIMQGVIDFISIINGEAYVVDYKTNNFKRIKDYTDKYALQLKLYADVVAESFGVKVRGRYIYSFTLGKFIEVN